MYYLPEILNQLISHEFHVPSIPVRIFIAAFMPLL